MKTNKGIGALLGLGIAVLGAAGCAEESRQEPRGIEIQLSENYRIMEAEFDRQMREMSTEEALEQYLKSRIRCMNGKDICPYNDWNF